MFNFIPKWQSRFNKELLNPTLQKEIITPELKVEVSQQDIKPDPKSDVFIGLNEAVDAIDKNASTSVITDKSFQLDLPLNQQLIQATGLDPRTLKIDWDKPGDAIEPELPILKLRRITDASGDGSLAEVFEDGALRINFSSDGWSPYINEIHVSDRVQRFDVDTNVNASVVAKDLGTGEVIELGTQRVDPNQGSFLVNLKDKLNAVSTLSLRDNYAIEVNFSGGHDNRPLESFSEVITLIKPMQYGNNHLGDETSDRQWNTQVMDVNGAWRFNTGSDDVVLVSLDTGFDADADGNADVHSDQSHAFNRSATNTIAPDENGNDASDHGHQAMSLMAPVHDNSEVAGIAPDASIWAYNLYRGGTTLYEAIDDAVKQRQNNQRLVFQGGVQGESWWTDGSTRAEMNGLLGSTSQSSFFSIAAGNGGPGGEPFSDPNYLNSVSGVAQAESQFGNIASVGALQFTGQDWVDNLLNATGTDLASYSNRGSNLTLVAPTDSFSILNGDGAVRGFGGTSAANPNLAGVAALVWSENANINGVELREILVSSATDLGQGGFDNTFGFGLVNAESAIRRTHALDQNQELASFWANNEFMA